MAIPKRAIAWFGVAATLIIFAAWLVLRSPVPQIDAATAQKLVAITDEWCRFHPSGKVPSEQWPAEVRRFRLHSVRISAEGMYIQLGSRFVESWGLFILHNGSSFQPGRGTDPSYRPLRGGVYWYEVKG